MSVDSAFAMLSIRPATVNDTAAILSMIRELADYLNELPLVAVTEAQLEKDGFGENPLFDVLLAEWDGEIVGYALFFDIYSTWLGRQLFLEDVFVRPQFRGRGIGMRLMAEVAQIAIQRGCRELRWEVLERNRNAIDFYRAMDAEFLDECKAIMLSGDAVRLLAKRAGVKDLSS